MDISWFGFLSNNMSWSNVGQSICRSLIKKGHNVDMFSTNGNKHFPEDLKPYLKHAVDLIDASAEDKRILNSKRKPKYDMQLSYTAMKNFQSYFTQGNVNRFGIWCYEFSSIGNKLPGTSSKVGSLPKGFAKYHNYVDMMLPPSEHARQVFLDSGVPSSKMSVLPHGVGDNFLLGTDIYPLKTSKKIKFLSVIAQPHIRKNIEGLLESWGKAFTKQDDVCLVLKVVNKKAEAPFEVNFNSAFSDFKSKYKNHAEVLVIDKFIDDLAPLYRACDVYFSMSMAESYNMPLAEMMSLGKFVICSSEGGQMDFCNEENSLLVNGEYIMTPKNAMYWEYNPSVVYKPNADLGAAALINAYKNHDSLNVKFKPSLDKFKLTCSWDHVVDQLLTQVK
jgi:glycosyltransferase involved in cell wall biosynthesis